MLVMPIIYTYIGPLPLVIPLYSQLECSHFIYFFCNMLVTILVPPNIVLEEEEVHCVGIAIHLYIYFISI